MIRMQKAITKIVAIAVTFTFILIVLNIYALSQLTDKANSALDAFLGHSTSLVGTSVLRGDQQPSTFSSGTSYVKAVVIASAC